MREKVRHVVVVNKKQERKWEKRRGKALGSGESSITHHHTTHTLSTFSLEKAGEEKTEEVNSETLLSTIYT